MSRADGRAPDELRPVVITPGYVDAPPGSALIEMGSTRVLCTVSLEDRVPPFLNGTGKGWLTAEYGMLPGSSPQRVARESSTGRPNGRTREIQRLIGRSLRAVVELGAIGERTLYVDCDVIQADGGTRTAAITGAYVALVHAGRTLTESGRLTASPVCGTLAAVSVGIVDSRPLLDLCYGEDSRAETDMNVVMSGDDAIIEIQATAEGRPFSRKESDQMLDLAAGGIARLRERQSRSLES
ncbi:ribonuclease PH [Candidatus Latescibacterota bacterium]